MRKKKSKQEEKRIEFEFIWKKRRKYTVECRFVRMYAPLLESSGIHCDSLQETSSVCRENGFWRLFSMLKATENSDRKTHT